MNQPDGGLTAADVRTVAFGKSPWNKRGYDQKSVNDFLQLVARRLEGRGLLSADDIRNISFPKPPLGRRGFPEGEVDAFLAEVTTAVAALGTG